MRKFRCSICGYIYDEAVGIPEKGIMPGTKWEEVSADFVCPVCKAPKSAFILIEENKPAATVEFDAAGAQDTDLKELSAGEIAAVCSNFAKGCEKQRLNAEMDAFNRIADYFKRKTINENGKTFGDIAEKLETDLSKSLPAARTAAKADADRGAMRSLVWNEKVSAMTKVILERYAKEGNAMLENTKVYVCEICGFIYIGDAPPETCPVCKVPSFKITQIGGI